MELTVNQTACSCADGEYFIKAEGCVAASLHWADAHGALADWQPFACVSLGPNGEGSYSFSGSRAVPKEATHVLARAISAASDRGEETLVPILSTAHGQNLKYRFLVMTDLHLSKKPWQVRKALSMGKGYDAVLITGDMTNDGTQAQLERFWQCVNEVIPEIPVFTVAGNHDYPAEPLPRISYGICDYPTLQQALLDRAKSMGILCQQDPSGAYTVTMGDTQIIGLNAVTHWRRFQFPDGGQLEWLKEQLQTGKAKRYVILCHAPLRRYQPYPSKNGQCYLNRDKVLQQILDEAPTEVIFLSGHTHDSMNCRQGSVERPDRKHLYINAGSIRPTTLKADEDIQPECWTEGNVVELVLADRQVKVTGISVKTGQKLSRGHYVFENG